MSDGAKKYRPYQPDEYGQQSYSPLTILPEDDLVFFLIDTVQTLDLAAIYAHYEDETRGAPPFEPRMMTTLLLYSYCVGVFSSRRIAQACERNLAFLAIVGGQRPDFRTISEFRRIHLEPLGELFMQVLRLAGELGLVKLGHLALDGSKFQANASRHKAMSYGYLEKEEERLRAEIAELLQRAETLDAEQDAALGAERGDELPAELKRREQRLAKLAAAKQRLEAEAQAKAAATPTTGATPAAGCSSPPGVPSPKAQTNFTDPEAKIMMTANKGWDYCGNAQVVVDDEHQIIVAAAVTMQANDKQQAVPMVEVALANLQAAAIDTPRDEQGQPVPIALTADSGYFSEKAAAALEGCPQLDPHLAVERQRHHQDPQAAAATPPPTPAAAKERMAQKLRTPAGKACYAKRKGTVEPVFGQIKGARGFRQFRLRGLRKIAAEWQLVCLTHNLLKIWRHQCALA